MTLGKSFLLSGFKLLICKIKQLFEISSISELKFINVCPFFMSNRRRVPLCFSFKFPPMLLKLTGHVTSVSGQNLAAPSAVSPNPSLQLSGSLHSLFSLACPQNPSWQSKCRS